MFRVHFFVFFQHHSLHGFEYHLINIWCAVGWLCYSRRTNSDGKLGKFHLPNNIAYSQGRHKRVKVFTFCHLPFSKYIRIDVTCHTCLMRCENEIAVIIQNG